ncbi:polysaccharide pyruvyl transferase CsaB [Limihaloglobus sulfuriphilus]|uniref:Polysaccharide pyruvyl transferase CsaB n=1 Tax=Limihaloglobus sulfuriphilus TaxID=1851148 RepID=A0A1Q2MB41_9BACT|nr:polysaccharide pyruvyl transferase family protein [Limihaloglobus sulfuriphilus]AQQ69906.1 polysaccharide pyruvyl transferase CsaB [Limihaloglobus sulfuriphilus]
MKHKFSSLGRFAVLLGFILLFSAAESLFAMQASQRDSKKTLQKNLSGKNDRNIMIGYLWGSTNIGDAAIAPGLLELLGKNLPKYSTSALCYSFKDPQKDDKLAWQINRLYPDCNVINGDAFKAAHAFALERLKAGHGGILPEKERLDTDYIFDTFAADCIDYIRENDSDVYREFSRTDLFIYNSGCVLAYGPGTLGGTDFWDYCLYRSLPLLLARKLGVPYGIYSHTFDDFIGEPGYTYFKNLLEDAEFVFCRDSDSLRYLLSAGIRAKNLSFVPDSTFSSPWKDPEWAVDFMNENSLEDNEFMAVVIFTRQPTSNSGRPIVSQQRVDEHMRKVREIIRHWVKTTGMKVVLCPEVLREMQPAKELIYDKLDPETKSKTVRMDTFWTHDQAKSLFASARLVVSMELHSLLLALPESTPVIHIPFKEAGRKSFFIADAGLGEYLLDIDGAGLDAMLDKVSYINGNYETERQRIKNTIIPYCREREKAAFEIIKNILRGE